MKVNLLARTIMTARDRVFNNFDLLENIYLFSSTFEIQVATDVSTFFRHVVESYIRLKVHADHLALLHPEYAPKSSTSTRYNRSNRNSTWHLFARTTYDEPVFFLRIPSEHVESILISERHEKFLRVLLGKERKSYAQIVTNIYGRNVRIWDADEKWVCNTAAVSRTVLNGQSHLARYLAIFYSSHQKGDIFELGTGVSSRGESGAWSRILQGLCLVAAVCNFLLR